MLIHTILSEDLDQAILREYNFAIQQIRGSSKGEVRRWIIYAGEQLEMAGYPKDKISTRLRNDLPELSTNYISTICGERGWTDQRFSHQSAEREVQTSEPKISSVSSSEEISAVSPSSRNRLTNEEIENGDYINHLQQKIEFLTQVQEKLKTRHFLSLLDEDQYKEYILVSDKVQEMAIQAWDDRYSIPVFSQFYLAEILVNSTIKHGALEYVAKIKEIASLSSKQVSKTLKGVVSNIHCLYEPATQAEALIDGFYGMQCVKCANWRVRWENGVCHCFACKHEYRVKATKLPLSRDHKEMWTN